MSVSDLEFFLGECYDFREMVEEPRMKCYGFKFQGNGFLTVFKLDVEEEHEDEGDTSCWGRT